MQYTRHAAASWVGFCLYGDGVAYPFPEGRASLLVCQMNCALKIEKLCNNKLYKTKKYQIEILQMQKFDSGTNWNTY